MKIENEIKQDKTIKEVEELPKEELKKLAGFGLMVIWVVSLVMGLGFNSWFLFFISLVLTFSYLCKINGIKGFAKSGHNLSSSGSWSNNYLNPCNPTGSSMRETRSNNYR